MAFSIGKYSFKGHCILAPMAGVTDRPFRQMCRSFGADMTVSEMITSKAELRQTRKSQLRMNHLGEPEPIIVQIAGTDAQTMAEAAVYQIEHGAHIIDINMGCPAKKVCKVDAGSALMKDENKVNEILTTVVKACPTPVTLKTRLGWDSNNKNVLTIAKIAEQAGINAIAIHGRTRDQKYNGEAEYSLIKQVKQQLSIPVFVNGDIDTEKKAKEILDMTQCDAIMLGRIAQQKPWIFNSINAYIESGEKIDEPSIFQRKQWLIKHIKNLHEFYGAEQGTRIARKHINWQCQNDTLFKQFKPKIMITSDPMSQIGLIEHYFKQLEQIQNAA